MNPIDPALTIMIMDKRKRHNLLLLLAIVILLVGAGVQLYPVFTGEVPVQP